MDAYGNMSFDAANRGKPNLFARMSPGKSFVITNSVGASLTGAKTMATTAAAGGSGGNTITQDNFAT